MTLAGIFFKKCKIFLIYIKAGYRKALPGARWLFGLVYARFGVAW